jgi:hypothetical protein
MVLEPVVNPCKSLFFSRVPQLRRSVRNEWNASCSRHSESPEYESESYAGRCCAGHHNDAKRRYNEGEMNDAVKLKFPIDADWMFAKTSAANYESSKFG